MHARTVSTFRLPGCVENLVSVKNVANITVVNHFLGVSTSAGGVHSAKRDTAEDVELNRLI